MVFEEQVRRYKSDPMFHLLVDTIQHFLLQGHVTVGELKDAVTYAGIMFEYNHVRPCIVTREDMESLKWELLKEK